jgi:hypothetical protein
LLAALVPGHAGFILRVPTGPSPAASGGHLAVATPTSVAFGASEISLAAPLVTVTLTNPGPSTAVLTGTPIVGGPDAAAFYVTGTTCVAGTLPAAASCTITLGFTPVSGGAAAADLTMESTAGAIVVPLSGSGLSQFTVSFVAPGGHHTLALRAGDTLWATGHNSDGQLGLGDTDQRNTFTVVPAP